MAAAELDYTAILFCFPRKRGNFQEKGLDYIADKNIALDYSTVSWERNTRVDLKWHNRQLAQENPGDDYFQLMLKNLFMKQE